MKNFAVKHKGKEYWISRSTAVVCFLYKKNDENNVEFVIGKRGKGCPDNVGLWNLPCGYIDYNETIKEAASREMYEETGLNVPSAAWKIVSVNSNPKDNENQTISFILLAEYSLKYGNLSTKHSEPNEVDELRWVDVEESETLDIAFNHEEIINKMSLKIK